jgi:hypothetical protein
MKKKNKSKKVKGRKRKKKQSAGTYEKPCLESFKKNN